LLPHDLILTAQGLCDSGRRKPRKADLKRAVSTAYYALFHALAKSCADSFIGSAKQIRTNRAWQQTYRALDHGFAKNACQNPAISQFPPAISDFAIVFATMQAKRHDADYNPFSRFYKSQVLIDIENAKTAIEAFQKANAKDKKAFAAWVLLKQRT
jgi:uncharacterized protein (UPF0332 family)